MVGTDLNIELDLLPTNLPPNQRLRGKVVDGRGKPVFGAVVSIQGALQGDRNWSGRVEGVDKAAITAADGTFLLTSTQAYQAWKLRVAATGFVALKTELLRTGDTQHPLKLDPGSSVNGMIVKDGKPVPGVTVGICQTNRRSGQFAGEYVIATDANGVFNFTSVVPGNTMTVYTKMEKGNPFTTEIAEFTSPQSDASIELGQLELRPAKTISGKISPVDGRPLPQNYRLSIGREYAWDVQTIDVDEHGYFEIKGLPVNEAITVAVRLKGYSVDHTRTNLQVLGSISVGVFTEENLDHIEIFLKPND